MLVGVFFDSGESVKEGWGDVRVKNEWSWWNLNDNEGNKMVETGIFIDGCSGIFWVVLKVWSGYLKDI